MASRQVELRDLELSELETAISETSMPVRALSTAPEGFRASMAQRTIQGVCFSELHSVGQVTLERDDELSAADPLPMVKVSLQLEGHSVLEQEGQVLRAEPADLLIYDTTQPYSISYYGPTRIVVIQAPHARIGVSNAQIADLAPAVVPGSTGLGRIVTPFLARFASALDELDEATATQLTHNAMGLLRTLLASHMDASAMAASPDWKLTQQVHEYVDAHLADPALSPTRVARANHVSLRKLHSLFAERGTTLGDYVRSRRLEKCYLALADPTREVSSVAAVGARWGFEDASYFSRAFKRAYRETPGEVRRRAVTRRADA